MAIITSVINYKGGVGKTTLAHHLGAGLTYRRQRILLLDLDPQCNLSYLAVGAEGYLRRTQSNQVPTIKDLFENFFRGTPPQAEELILKHAVTSSRGNVFNHVDIVLSHLDVTNLDIKLSRFNPAASSSDHADMSLAEIDKLSVIKRFLDQAQNDYDHIIIDCPPSIHPVTQNAIFASHYYIIPAMPDFLSTVGISQVKRLMETMDSRFKNLCAYVGQSYTPIQCAGIIFNKVNEYGGHPIRTHQQYMEETRQVEPHLVFDSYLVDGHGIEDAAQKNQPIFAYESQRSIKPKVLRQIECLNQIISEFQLRVREGVLQ